MTQQIIQGYLTTRQYATRYNVTMNVVQDMLHSGKLPFERIGNGKGRIYIPDIVGIEPAVLAKSKRGTITNSGKRRLTAATKLKRPTTLNPNHNSRQHKKRLMNGDIETRGIC